MAAVDLTALRFAEAVPFAVTNGNSQNAPGGTFHVDRPGDRWGFQFVSRPYRVEPEGAEFQALFDDAEKHGGLFRVHQPGFDPGAPGTPVVASTTSAGKLVPLTGLNPNYPIRRRQFVSFVVGGQRFLDRVMDEVVAGADGTAMLRLKNLLRVTLPAGTLAELADPKIEGSVTFSSPSSWQVNRLTTFAFTVTEDR